MRNNNSKIFSLFLLILALPFAMASCATTNFTSRADEPPATGTVKEAELVSITLDAALTAADLANLYAINDWSYSGLDNTLVENWETFTVDQVNVKVGDHVQKGDVLAIIQEPEDLIDKWLYDTRFLDDASLKLITREEFIANHKEIYESSAKAGLAYYQEQFDNANEYYDSISAPRASQAELSALQSEMDAADLDMRKIINKSENYTYCYSNGNYEKKPFNVIYFYDECYFRIYNTSDSKNFSAAYDRKNELTGEYNYLSATFTDEEILVARIRKNNAKAELDKAQKAYDGIMAGDYSFNFYSGYYWDDYLNRETFQWYITENGIFDEYDAMDALRSRFIITAPFDGVILSVNLKPGEQIKSSSFLDAFQMVDPRNTRLLAKVPELFIDNIDLAGQVAITRANSDVNYSGEILSLDPVGNKNTASVVVSESGWSGGLMVQNQTEVTFDLLVKFEMPENLPFIGATYQLQVPLKTPISVLSVPANGLRRDGKNTYVTVTGAGEDFEVPVNVITSQGQTILVEPVYPNALLIGDQILLINE